MDDFSDLLDRAIPSEGGPLPSTHVRVAAGRRAVRKRRTAVGGGVAALALAVAVVAPQVLPWSDSSGPPVAEATQETAPATNQPIAVHALPRHYRWLVSYVEGSLKIEPGVEFERRVEDPVNLAGVASVGGIIRYQGQQLWVLSGEREGIVGTSAVTAPISGRSFEEWLGEQRVLVSDVFTQGEPQWVTLGSDGVLSAAEGVKIIEQRTPARLDQASPDMVSASGMIEVDGARLCVLARDGGIDVGVLYLAESEYQGCDDAIPAWGLRDRQQTSTVNFKAGLFTPNQRPGSDTVTIVRQIANPEMPPKFAPAAGTGVVEYTLGAERYFGFARDFGGSVEQYELKATPGQTLEDFLAVVREAFKTGEPTGRFAH